MALTIAVRRSLALRAAESQVCPIQDIRRLRRQVPESARQVPPALQTESWCPHLQPARPNPVRLRRLRLSDRETDRTQPVPLPELTTLVWLEHRRLEPVEHWPELVQHHLS